MHPPALGAPLLLIASVVVVTILGWIVPPLRRALILDPFLVRTKGQVWRLLTAGWLHGGVAHLAFNMLTLHFFAEPVARALGAAPFVALYTSAVAVAFVPSTLGNMHKKGFATLGASGAVAAVMFSAILFNPKLRVGLWFVPLPVPGWVFALGYLAYSAWEAHTSDKNINHTAHFAGAIYGMLFTFAFEPTRVASAIRSLL